MPRRSRKHAERFVYFCDQAPKIGAGWRGIDVISLGHKWVKIEAHASGKRARLRRAVWDQLMAARANAPA